jgi:hypothetical protein
MVAWEHLLSKWFGYAKTIPQSAQFVIGLATEIIPVLWYNSALRTVDNYMPAIDTGQTLEQSEILCYTFSRQLAQLKQLLKKVYVHRLSQNPIWRSSAHRRRSGAAPYQDQGTGGLFV